MEGMECIVTPPLNGHFENYRKVNSCSLVEFYLILPECRLAAAVDEQGTKVEKMCVFISFEQRQNWRILYGEKHNNNCHDKKHSDLLSIKLIAHSSFKQLC